MAARKAMKLAREESHANKHPYIGTEHILVGLLLEDSGIAAAVLRQAGVSLEEVRKEISIVPTTNQLAVGAIPFTSNAKEALEASVLVATNLRHNYIGTEHLLLGIISNLESSASQILEKLDISIPAIEASTADLIGGGAAATAILEKEKEEKEDKNNKKVSSTPVKKDKSALSQFGRDLTEMAREGKLDPLIGREVEIERALLILARRTKNNPLLLGEPGVGKTAIVEGIAQRIITGEVPESLIDHRIVALDLPAMVAGTKYRGQFEERIKAVMAEASKEPVILFIDEIHSLIGAGGAEGAIDAANVLKPALSRGEIRCMGATTLDEFRKYIEKDGALTRRFQPIIVEPPTVGQTIEILKGLQSKYEEFHSVKYDEDALECAVKLSDRYITARFLPDKAIDVIDEAGARAVMEGLRPKEVSDLEKQLAQLELEKTQAVANQNFEEAANCRDAVDKVKAKLKVEVGKQKSKTRKIQRVTKEAITETVAKITGVPLSAVSSSEADKLINLERQLGLTVIGQERAKINLAKSLRRKRAGLGDPRRPSCFLFLGPTGTGKSLLVKELAKVIFNSEDALITIDMSEYMEKHNVSRLIGAAPGYVGYSEGGQLTEAVKRKPYSILMFDEIEKAHPEVFNIFLQIMEDGNLTDSSGCKIDFRNTIIVMTSNIGSDVIKNKTSLGFGSSTTTSEIIMESQISDEVSKVFRPEFLNRLDGSIIFHPLTKEELIQVLSLELGKVFKRLNETNRKVTLTTAAKEFLLEHGWNPDFGARPLRRTISLYVEDLLADEILKGNFPVNSCKQLDKSGFEEKLMVIENNG